MNHPYLARDVAEDQDEDLDSMTEVEARTTLLKLDEDLDSMTEVEARTTLLKLKERSSARVRLA
jgi:hypothetical protein